MNRRSLLALLTGLSLVVGCGRAAAPPPSTPHALLGSALPAFRRPTLAGSEVDTAKLRGQVVVVKLFAKYCAPCMRTLPEAQRAHEAFPDVAFVGIAEDDAQADAESVVAQFKLTFPVVLDRDNVLSGRLRVQELPMTIVVDREGVVRWVGGGEQPDGALRDAVASVRGG
jgi:thiol-disulfide isomerase/thioredoxin